MAEPAANGTGNMTLRRLPAALPLAALVALLAHVAAVGFGHAPGGPYANELALGIGLALALLTLGAFARGALGPPRHRIATNGSDGYPAWLLAAAGFAAYAGLELAEGHLALGGALRALAAVLPAALTVAVASRRIGSFVRRAGARFAGVARSRSLRSAAGCGRWSEPGARPTSILTVAKRRGRAPPAFA